MKKKKCSILKIGYLRRPLIISLLLHLLFIFFPTELLFEPKELKKNRTDPQRIRLVLKDHQKKQVITTENDTPKRSRNVEDHFLSKTNQKYHRQTVAKKVGRFKNAAQGQRTPPLKVLPKVRPLPLPTPSSTPRSTSIRVPIVKKGRGKISLKDLSLAHTTPSMKPLNAPIGQKNGQVTERGPARTNDYIENIPLGDITKINTLEYKYYGFYYRIKQKLEQHWSSSLKKRANALYISGRRLPARRTQITSLSVTLNGKGHIITVVVKSSSGVRELDAAAIESFNNAGPFPNPPKGMIKNGKMTIEWGFVVKT